MGRKWATVVLVAALAGLLVGLGIWIRQPRDFADEGLVRQAMAVGEVGQMVEGLAGEWPQWRGPKRDGQMDSESARGLLAGKPAQRWETELGEGYASPVLVGGQVIVAAHLYSLVVCLFFLRMGSPLLSSPSMLKSRQCRTR